MVLELIIVAVAVGVFLFLTLQVTTSVRQLQRSQVGVAAKIEAASAAITKSEPAAARPSILVPDYIDEALIREIARQLAVDTEPAQYQFGTASSRGAKSKGAVQVELGVPRVARATADLGGSETTEQSTMALITRQRGGHLRSIIDALVAAAMENGMLVDDLDVVPPSAEPEAAFVQSAVVLRYEWGMSPLELGDAALGIESPGEDGDGESSSANSTSTPEDADYQMRVNLAGKLTELEKTATEIMGMETRERFDLLSRDRSGALALVKGTGWMVSKEDDQLSLRLARLKTSFGGPHTRPDIDEVPVICPMVVPLSDEHLLAHGRHRFQDEEIIESTSVLGRIEGSDSSGSLIVFPLAVYSGDGSGR